MSEESSTPSRPQRALLARLPLWLSRWVGYRPASANPEPVYVLYVWPFLGAFCGLALLQAVFGQAKYFIDRGVPSIVASYGASAVLCYGAVASPLAQPRALVGGHFLSALVGVVLAQIFRVHRHHHLRWLASSLSTAIAIVVMQFTKTTHPPAGATALLPILDEAIIGIGWYFLPVVLLSSLLILVTALLFNNIQRRYPTFWYSPASIATLPTPKSGDQAIREAPDNTSFALASVPTKSDHSASPL